MEVVIILVLILLNGIFSMAEIALVSARKVRLENAAKQGDDKARAALKLSNNPTLFVHRTNRDYADRHFDRFVFRRTIEGRRKSLRDAMAGACCL